MAFSCSYMLSKVRDSDCEKNGKEIKNAKRPYPFSTTEDANDSETILPEAVDVLDSIFSSLCPFAEEVETQETSATDSPLVDKALDDNHEQEVIKISSSNSEASDDSVIIQEETVNDDEAEKTGVDYDFSHIPLQITGSWNEFVQAKENNFTRGCKWAPDGSCILSCSNDNILRLFNLPFELWDASKWEDISEMSAVIKISEGELIYDFCWYPQMNSAEPPTCCLASSSRSSPVHLWDAFTGELRCSYRCYDQMDEVTAARSLSFDSEGQRIFCGFEKTIRIFNVDLPGRSFEERKTFAKKSGQAGIISCFAFTPANKNISAVGSYRKSIGIYSEPDGNLECILEGQKGGITHLQFSPDGNLLYSGGRKDPEILCWDLRNLGTVLYSLRRNCTTNQRMYFDITSCGRYVISGNYNGAVTIWDTYKEPQQLKLDDFCVLEPVQFYLAHSDCVNGISVHPTYPLLCTSSGQRKFPDLLSDDEDGMFAKNVTERDNSLRLWWIGK